MAPEESDEGGPRRFSAKDFVAGSLAGAAGVAFGHPRKSFSFFIFVAESSFSTLSCRAVMDPDRAIHNEVN